MKTLIGVLLCLAVGTQMALAQVPDWEWAVQSLINGSEQISADRICSDPSENIYLSGVMSGHIFISQGILKVDSLNSTEQSSFLVKFDKEGKALFGIQVADDFPAFWNVATDSSGNCYVSGTCSRPFILPGGFNVVSGPYIIKFRSDGIIQWVKNFPARRFFANINAIASTKFGDLFMTGSFRDTMSFQGKMLFSPGLNTNVIFVARLNSAGDVIWLKKAGGRRKGSSDIGAAICIVDDSENPSVYISGTAREDSTFFDDLFILGRDSAFYSQANSQSGGGFIAKYNGNGKVEWVRGSDSHRGMFIDMSVGGICTDHFGNIYLTGSFDADSGFFNSPNIHTIWKYNSNHNAFFIKFDKSGLIKWLRTNLSAGYDDYGRVYGTSVCLDDKDNVYISGNFVGLTNFNGHLIEIDTPEYYHMYIMKFGSDGTEAWRLTTGESGWPQVIFTNNHLYAGGSFYDSLRLRSDILLIGNYPYAFNNLFLAKLSNAPSLVNSRQRLSDNLFTFYPNPASSQITITYTLVKPGNVTIEISDLTGRQAKQVSLEMMSAGEHSEILDLHGLISGTYVCRMTGGGVVSSEVFTIVK